MKKRLPDLARLVQEMQQEADQLRKELAGSERKRVRLARLESQLSRASSFLRGDAALLDKPKSRSGYMNGKRAKTMQHGSSMWWSAKVLQMAGKPMHIDKLLPRIQAESGQVFKKATMVSNLSRYLKYEDTFNRPAPNVFGLIDFTKDIDEPLFDMPVEEEVPDSLEKHQK